MPRERRTAIFPIALSPAKMADCLGVKAEVIQDAIKDGELPCYQKGTKRRVLVSDCVAWVKRTWRAVR
jgi:excisionase family DNA binding protein